MTAFWFRLEATGLQQFGLSRPGPNRNGLPKPSETTSPPSYYTSMRTRRSGWFTTLFHVARYVVRRLVGCPHLFLRHIPALLFLLENGNFHMGLLGQREEVHKHAEISTTLRPKPPGQISRRVHHQMAIPDIPAARSPKSGLAAKSQGVEGPATVPCLGQCLDCSTLYAARPAPCRTPTPRFYFLTRLSGPALKIRRCHRPRVARPSACWGKKV